MTKEKIDILVVIPLEEELLEFQRHFPPAEDRSSETQYCRFHKTPGGHSMVVVQQEEMGRSSALTVLAEQLEQFEPSLVVCLGIAASLGSDAKLGDVCYTGSVIDVYDCPSSEHLAQLAA